MKMEVEIISKEFVKPSSPTPLHLKYHKLSFFDLCHRSSGYIPLVLYYPFNQDTNVSSYNIHRDVSKRLQILRQSLSETLSRFYPLAGRIKDTNFIECNHEGVYFAEAKVRSPLNEFLKHPNLSLISNLLPDESGLRAIPENCTCASGVQATTFSCGGIVVGVIVTHTIVDGTAFSLFLKSWASTAVMDIEKVMSPKFDASSIFSYGDSYPREVFLSPLSALPTKVDKFITRRFVFDALAIANLKAKAATSSSVQNPTRVEVVTALFGKCFKAVLKETSGSNKSFLLAHAVNLRRKARPQFSEYLMGNCAWLVSFICKDDEETELHDLVCKFREATAKLNGDFVNSLQGDGGFLNFIEAIKHERETYYTNRIDMIVCSSWCNFEFYDLDFGWGKPAWVSAFDFSQVVANSNVVLFMDTKDRNGIEAWVTLHEEQMAVLERDKELLAFATLDPSPLKEY
ncbi:vinorine synthase-like [Melia azedarach]|uniref:Vinorine synthase-like n=1 Tax=Melia azedarach TaxID=155640 RepID=A0ACC1YKS2_MELAZ|nr:vinorine synthase-like [Melia azedarach]